MNKDEMIKEMQKDLVLSEQDCVWLYEKEGYRKIADDEIVLKFDDLVKRDEKIKEFAKNKVTKETAREILQYLKRFEGWNKLDVVCELIADKYGIELE